MRPPFWTKIPREDTTDQAETKPGAPGAVAHHTGPEVSGQLAWGLEKVAPLLMQVTQDPGPGQSAVFPLFSLLSPKKVTWNCSWELPNSFLILWSASFSLPVPTTSLSSIRWGDCLI